MQWTPECEDGQLDAAAVSVAVENLRILIKGLARKSEMSLLRPKCHFIGFGGFHRDYIMMMILSLLQCIYCPSSEELSVAPMMPPSLFYLLSDPAR